MNEIILLIAITYAVSFSLGHILHKYLKMPWMFSALFFGMILSSFGLFRSSLQSESFQLLANIGMLVILFIIGFNINLKEIMKLKKYIFLGTIFIMSLEGILGSLLFYFVFPSHVHNSFLVALIASFSFATVGEAILLPILAEFKVLKTTFGQLTLGIGTVDDILEVLMLTIVASLPMFLHDTKVQNLPNPWFMLITLGCMFAFSYIIIRYSGGIKKYLKKNSENNSTSSLLVPLFFCSFTALGGFVFEELATVGAILSGIIVHNMLPKKMRKENEKEINFLGYSLLSPIFFLSMGREFSFNALLLYPLMVFSIWFVAKGSKLLASYICFHKLLGNKKSLLLGLGLSVRFSTSLIVQFILLNSGYISLALYSALLTTAILMKPIIVGIFSWGLANGNFHGKKAKNDDSDCSKQTYSKKGRV